MMTSFQRHVTSAAHSGHAKRKKFSTYFLPTESHCQSFNAFEVLKGSRICAPPLPPTPTGLRDEKKPRLNRVNRLFFELCGLFFKLSKATSCSKVLTMSTNSRLLFFVSNFKFTFFKILFKPLPDFHFS